MAEPARQIPSIGANGASPPQIGAVTGAHANHGTVPVHQLLDRLGAAEWHAEADPVPRLSGTARIVVLLSGASLAWIAVLAAVHAIV